MSALFVQMDGDSAVLQSGGVYRPCDLYTSGDGAMFAKVGGGFVRIYANGSTSKPGTSVSALVTDVELTQDAFARLCVGDSKKGNARRALPVKPLYLQRALGEAE